LQWQSLRAPIRDFGTSHLVGIFFGDLAGLYHHATELSGSGIEIEQAGYTNLDQPMAKTRRRQGNDLSANKLLMVTGQ
jgi:hypothetical protein